MINTIRLFPLLIVGGLIFLAQVGKAQSAKTPRETALEYLRGNATKFGLTPQDVSDVQVTDEYVSSHNGLTHVWVQQQYHNIPVFNGLFGLHVTRSGEVLTMGHRFVPQLEQKINTTLPSLSATKALELAMADIGFSGFKTPNLQQKINERSWIFDGGAVSKEPIKITAVFQPEKGGNVLLCWAMVIAQANTADVWSIRVDAQSGRILGKNNRTVYCKAGHAHRAGEACGDNGTASESASAPNTPAAERNNPNMVDEKYKVFPFPAESPEHGTHTLVVNPANPIASPHGWLDVNGVDGADAQVTRGNNVFAYPDINGSDVPPADNLLPNGGAETTFDFPFSPDVEPEANQNSAITNLFYVNNMMHDITYLYGFDEKAGNFQFNNYGNGGQGSDEVYAEGLDGGGEDNANFATPSDGGNGRMQMYKWSRSGGRIVTANGPSAVQGTYFGSASSGWGAAITNVPVTGDVVIVDDGTPDATKGCNPPINNLQGKIVIIDRGVCQFGEKALNAQQAGAKGCIICNFEDATIGMAAGTSGASVTIPVVMMKKSDCDALRQYAGNGLNISFVLPPSGGPDFLDGDFDNGIIAHEYGHGISNRLTGGPSNADCLGNAEQMGEGWSDYFSLITTAEAGDAGNNKRGIGTYVLRQGNDGQGIRRYPYTTDMNISPVTFGTVAENTQVHALGEVWAAVTWDLYWAMVEKYGFDADFTNTNSGNGRAIQLVMDGMKLQPCSPGFIDGRDAIMMADKVNYAGADTCLIMSVFARRGMGVYANQFSSESASDGVENFDPIPTCVKEIKIKKECTATIAPGEDVTFTITVTNHKDANATGVVVRDELPDWLTLISASNGGTFSNNEVTWNLGTVPMGQSVVLTYRAKSDPTKGSLRLYRDELETSDDWFSTVVGEGDEIFFLQENIKKTGNFAWQANNVSTETDFGLEGVNTITIAGDKPVLRFWHQFNTEKGADGGFLEFRKAGSQQWQRISAEKVVRNPYSGKIKYGTFAIPFLDGFSGSSNGWMQSYVDMSQFVGEQIVVRFRFGSDETVGGQSWVVDDIEMLDLLSYDGSACVTTAQGDNVCDNAPEKGVIVNPIGDIIPTQDILGNSLAISVQPNPAYDVLYVSIGQELKGAVSVGLFSADGKLVKSQSYSNLSSGAILQMDVAAVPAGMYLLKVLNDSVSGVEKVIVR